MWGLCSPCSKV
uniref:Uncharacterized protein n=1 Tax=Arundo donax TaxID=35708 RepID=A0A0A9EUR1_ARUDO